LVQTDVLALDAELLSYSLRFRMCNTVHRKIWGLRYTNQIEAFPPGYHLTTE